ncbi:cathepsin L1-like isoform X1 [Puma concolor]|uniref:Procathepsin L n=1 Tax=Puma concolor TaxID=9696 RepID=A0A6P6IH54_PUMCO|nr:cathepsin L1-like isoform X1 [Puma concolor]
MHPSLFLAALCLGIASAAPQVNQSLDEQWSQWKATHGKLYGMNEEGWRRAVWGENMKMIEQHNREYNQKKHSFTMAMNGFGDMTNEEFRQVMNGLQIQKHKKGKVFQPPLFAEIPSSVNWRKKGYVTPMKNQGQCASGWAFSATGAIEGQMFGKTHKLVSLSEQNLLDCAWSEGNGGCSGGNMDNAFQYVKDNGGLDSEESYPYHAQLQSCKYNPENSAADITGFLTIPKTEYKLMRSVAIVGPVSAAIDASLDTFRFYDQGIYYDSNCSHEILHHGVLIVGYGFEGAELDNKKYWIVKNSWGEAWGIDGYILMAKDRDNHCGIASLASFPTV